MTTTTPAGRTRTRKEPSDTVPCRSCGFAVKRPDPTRAEVLQVYPAPRPMLANVGVPIPPTEFAVTRCDDCTDRRTLAESLLAAHPRVRRIHGQVALDRLDAALAALDARGLRGARALKPFTSTDRALLDLIEALAPLGGAASWAVTSGGASTKRWAHVPDELTQRIKDDFSALVHRRAEVAEPYAPPRSLDGAVMAGCLMCGVGALIVKPSDVAAAWGNEVRINVASLGGRTRPEPVVGHICPKCRTTVEKVGVPGMPAVQRAVFAHFGFELRSPWEVELSNIRGWAALPPGTDPNREPWAHLDLARLRSKFARWESEMYLRRLDAR